MNKQSIKIEFVYLQIRTITIFFLTFERQLFLNEFWKSKLKIETDLENICDSNQNIKFENHINEIR